jgi:hypothetical protein
MSKEDWIKAAVVMGLVVMVITALMPAYWIFRFALANQ